MGVVITGIGSYIPEKLMKNEDFLNHTFLDRNGSVLKDTNPLIIKKFKAITGIEERRYATENVTTSDMAFYAAEKAIAQAGVNPEELDYIILAHNFGDVKHNTQQSDILPSLATRVKHRLNIQNPSCIAYDILFGCPGWLEGVIQAKAFIKANMAKKCLVIGAEALSRVVDVHDRDSMIFSDGAGASVVEDNADENSSDGILAHQSATYAANEAYYLDFGCSNNKTLRKDIRYIKMEGRKIYNFALSYVPKAMKECLDKSGERIENLKKIFIHQANEKMDHAICERFFKLYDKPMPEDIMPMSIHSLGNSSVATIPTLIDLVNQGEIKNQTINQGDLVIFASVGSGMNVNAMVYKY